MGTSPSQNCAVMLLCTSYCTAKYDFRVMYVCWRLMYIGTPCKTIQKKKYCCKLQLTFTVAGEWPLDARVSSIEACCNELRGKWLLLSSNLNKLH